jgi:hypothetical protein
MHTQIDSIGLLLAERDRSGALKLNDHNAGRQSMIRLFVRRFLAIARVSQSAGTTTPKRCALPAPVDTYSLRTLRRRARGRAIFPSAITRPAQRERHPTATTLQHVSLHADRAKDMLFSGPPAAERRKLPAASERARNSAPRAIRPRVGAPNSAPSSYALTEASPSFAQ